MKTTKLYLFLIIGFLSGCDKGNVTSTTKNMTNKLSIQAKSSVKMAALSTWDWQKDEYSSYDGEQIPAPWRAEDRIGISLSNAKRCNPSDGWKLWIKQINLSDRSATSRVNTNGIGPENPYFVLYNEYTGVMRVFMYLGGESTIGEDYFAVNTSIGGDVGNEISDIGLFLNDGGDYSYPLSSKSPDLNENKFGFIKNPGGAIYKKWLVIDYTLSFDPTLNNYHNKFIHIRVGAVDTSDINIEGSFNFKMNTITQGGQNIVSALLDEVFGSSGKIKSRMDDVEAFQDNLNDVGNRLKGKAGFLDDVGKSLLSVASFIDPATAAIGFGAGIVDYISSFTNIFGGGSTQVKSTYGKGGMHATGVITNSYSVANHTFGIPLVQYTDPAEKPSFQDSVGLFSLKQKPNVTLVQKQFQYQCRNNKSSQYSQYTTYGTYLQFDDQNMKTLFKVNPETDMKLVEVKAVPIISVRSTSLSRPFELSTYFTPINEANVSKHIYSRDKGIINLYDSDSHYNKTISVLPDPARKFEEGYLVLGADNNSFPNRMTTAAPMTCRDIYSPTGGQEVDMRFYLRFENNDNKNIKAEFMRTYHTHVTTVYE